jgi:hypothetical protein
MALVIQAKNKMDFEQLEKAIERVNASRFSSTTLYIHRKKQPPIECNVKDRTIILLGNDAKVFLRWAKEQCCVDNFSLSLQSRFSKNGINEGLRHAFIQARLNRHRTFVVPSSQCPALDTDKLVSDFLLGSLIPDDSAEEKKYTVLTRHVAGKKRPEKINTQILLEVACRINAHGLQEIHHFLTTHHQRGAGALCSTKGMPTLTDWVAKIVTQAPNVWLDNVGALQIAQSFTTPIIEIKPWESVSGQGETCLLSQQGVDVAYEWMDATLDFLCENTVKKITVEQSEHEVGFFCETFNQPWEVFFKKDMAGNGFMSVMTQITHEQELRQAIRQHPWMSFLGRLNQRCMDSLLEQFISSYFFKHENALCCQFF